MNATTSPTMSAAMDKKTGAEIAPASLPGLTIVGCGNVGKVLGRLWQDQRVFELVDILNPTLESGRRAADFIGAGRAVSDYAELGAADVFLIATPDDQIGRCCDQLGASGLLSGHSIVFHCSGSLSSAVLACARSAGAAVASAHPIRSFADPMQVLQSFPGTWCGIEGDATAHEIVGGAFTLIGAQLAPIDPDFKMLYHAAAVFASNYLVTVLDVAVQAYAKAGIPNETALKMIAPLVHHTSDNVLKSGTENALSGPIARGDHHTVIRQYQAVNDWDKRYGRLYKSLGLLTSDLAQRSGRNKRSDDS